MHKNRFLFPAVIFVLLPGSVHAQGSVSANPRFEGKWTGDVITDAFRGEMELTITEPADWKIALSVKVRDRVSAGPGVVQRVIKDSIFFSSGVGGAATTYAGVLRGDSLIGTMEARQDGQLLGRGTWLLKRGAAAAAPANGVSSPLAIFDEAWSLVDSRYGNFPAKGIDWNLIKSIYREEAGTATTDRQLAGLLSRMLSHLNDNHISLRVKDTLYHPNGDIDRSSFVADSIVARRFVGPVRASPSAQWTSAWMADSIAYIRMDGFQNMRAARAEIDTVLTRFRGARGIVLDLRKHFGGDDRGANEVINRFATGKLVYLSSRTRSGAGHADFLPPHDFVLEPSGSWQFTRPVMILTSRRTVSAGENFLLGMREIPHVTVIGDVTSGAFADVGHFKLANGWELNFPFNRFVDRNGVSWEGVGLAPDIRLVASQADIAAGKDVVLDFAVRAVKASRRGS